MILFNDRVMIKRHFNKQLFCVCIFISYDSISLKCNFAKKLNVKSRSNKGQTDPTKRAQSLESRKQQMLEPKWPMIEKVAEKIVEGQNLSTRVKLA